VPDAQPTVSTLGIRFPVTVHSPWWILGRRVLLAVAILTFTVLLVWFDRDGYTDSVDGTVDLGDAIYYTTVTLSTTGYGDIAPVTDSARLINAFVITPLRIAFLVLLIGTTIEALTSESRTMFKIAQWRKRMKDHVVVVGYGTKGRSATESLLGNGVSRKAIVVVDPTPSAQAEANNDGLTVIKGNATRREILRRAGATEARQIIVSTNSDDATILCVLNARQLNHTAHIVAAVRESDNVGLVKQSGADAVVTSSDSVGRLLGLSAVSPSLGSVIDDLLTYGEGLEVAEREILVPEVGKQPQQLPDQVIAVVRDDQVHRYYDPVVTQLARGDKVVVVRPSTELPWAPRPGTHGEDFAIDRDE
jgi:voltage-gated potassium channel